MQMELSSALALMRMHEMSYFQDFGSRDLLWLAVGALLGSLIFWGFSRRKRRWL